MSTYQTIFSCHKDLGTNTDYTVSNTSPYNISPLKVYYLIDASTVQGVRHIKKIEIEGSVDESTLVESFNIIIYKWTTGFRLETNYVHAHDQGVFDPSMDGYSAFPANVIIGQIYLTRGQNGKFIYTGDIKLTSGECLMYQIFPIAQMSYKNLQNQIEIQPFGYNISLLAKVSISF